jgi:hypothetical protein
MRLPRMRLWLRMRLPRKRRILPAPSRRSGRTRCWRSD